MGVRGVGASKIPLLLLLAVAAWPALAPTRLGGANTMLVTNGTSMEPQFHSGDLAIVRRSPPYHVGDVVGYRLTARTVVLHRIVGEQDGRFIMKGDNNSWLDGAQPDPSQVVGKLWLHLPGAGALLTRLRSPVMLALLMLAVVSTAILGGPSAHNAPKRRTKQTLSGSGAWSSVLSSAQFEEGLGLAVTIGLVALVAALIAFSRPAQRAVPSGVPYTESGVFTYSGAATGGVYTGDQVSTGQPVYLKLVRNLQVNFDYRLSAAAPHSVHGSYELQIAVGQESGWERSADLVPETPFQGDHVAMQGTIPLDQVQSLVASFADQTGIKDSTYTVTVTPTVKAEGTLAGAAFRDQFAPPLRFRMDGYQLVLARQTGEPDPLAPAQSGLAPRSQMEPNHFSIFGLTISVTIARVVSLIVLLAAGAAAVALVPLIARARQADEATQIEARYRPLLLQVLPDPSRGEAGQLVDVLRIEDLVKLARQTGRMIFHEQDGGEHRYFVTDAGVVYRYCHESRERAANPDAPGTSATSR